MLPSDMSGRFLGELRSALRSALWGDVDARHVALLRILTMAVWLHDLARMAPFVSLHYDPIVGSAEVWFAAWVLTTLAVLLGFHARLFSALGFIVTSIFVTLDHVIYHVDYYLLLTFFYFMFIETDRAWSVRSWLAARRGAALSRRVWVGPVTLFSLHLAFIYLNAGLAHILLNRSWREGYALSQSFANPVWRAPAGEFLAHLGVPTWPMDFGTIALEVGFAPLWIYAVLRPAARELRIVLAFALIAFHVAIAVFLNIGAFSHYVIATAIVFFPTAWIFRAVPGSPELAPAPADQATARRGVALAFLSFFLLLALLVQPPVDELALRRPKLADVLERAKRTLALTGDVRHHNVFPEVVTERVFYTVIYFAGGERLELWPLLFDERGERVGWGTDMRIFMSLRLPLRGLGVSTVQGKALPVNDALRVLQIALPLLKRDLTLQRNLWVSEVRILSRGYVLGRKLGDPYVAGPTTTPIACFRVERTPELGLVPSPCKAPSGSD